MQFLALLHSLRAALNREEMMESKLAATAAFFIPLYSNFPLISAFAACVVGQVIKFFIFWYKESQWSIKKLFGSGGMPSSHSAIVTALAVAIGLQDGLGGPPFATALVSACVVLHDATCARLQAQAGQQAQSQVVNQIDSELPTEHLLAQSTPLNALLGHTWLEVVFGGMLGILTAAIIDFTTDLPVYQYCRSNENQTATIDFLVTYILSDSL